MVKLRRGAPVVEAPKASLVPDPQGFTDRVRLGDLLVEERLVAREVVEAAIGRSTGSRLGTILLDDGLIDETALARTVAQQLRVPFIDLKVAEPQADALTYLDEGDAHRLDALPMSFDNGVLQVALGDPLRVDLYDLLRAIPVGEVRISVAAPSFLRARLNQSYRALSAVDIDVDAFAISDVANAAELVDTINVSVDDDAPVVAVVTKILTQALRDRASDVHIEPTDVRVRVRYRIDGRLNEVLSLPSEMGPAIVSRIKIMAEMNIVERRRPQDGQFEMNVDGRGLDVRVSTTSTIWGEKTVMRLLDRSRSLFRLGDLGMPERLHENYSKIVRSPFGMVIVSGPTGSGKTTTLYATLSEINRPDMNVMTIEDPVEYVFPMVNQIQISEQAGLTFASGLKSILRQDPDVILVGEVRDVETARIAVQSAMTGHLVLSSVHAIDSISALYRLLDMGVETFLITSAVIGVVAQRLVRRICKNCAVTYEPPMTQIALFRKLGGGEKDVWWKGEGCTFCSGTGFFDRIGVYEVLTLSEEVRQSVIDGNTPKATREIAIEQGLSSLQAEAMQLVAQDLTTIDEVIRHVFVSEAME